MEWPPPFYSQRPENTSGYAICLSVCLSVCLSKELDIHYILQMDPYYIKGRILRKSVFKDVHWSGYLVKMSLMKDNLY